jgi:hypothetical protein
MRKVIALTLAIALTLSLGSTPANAAKCDEADTASIRSLFVSVIRISAHQGRNVEENHKVLSNIRSFSKSIKSNKLVESLSDLKGVIEQGGLHPGSTDFWGYREGSAWKTYKATLTMTQKDLC